MSVSFVCTSAPPHNEATLLDLNGMGVFVQWIYVYFIVPGEVGCYPLLFVSYN